MHVITPYVVPARVMLRVCPLPKAAGLWLEWTMFPLLGRTARHNVPSPGPITVLVSCEASAVVGILTLSLLRSIQRQLLAHGETQTPVDSEAMECSYGC